MDEEKDILHRCGWVDLKDPLMVRYHDTEWGVPQHDDRKLFELLMLECFQAGLTWKCVLDRREGLRRAFDGFDPEKISRYSQEDQARLLADPGIIRNRLKVQAAVTNSRVFLDIQKGHGSFDAYLWGFTGGRTIRESCDLRSTSPLSDQVSGELKKRGMKFVGSTIIYAFLQAAGVLDPHAKECDLYQGDS